MARPMGQSPYRGSWEAVAACSPCQEGVEEGAGEARRWGPAWQVHRTEHGPMWERQAGSRLGVLLLPNQEGPGRGFSTPSTP